MLYHHHGALVFPDCRVYAPGRYYGSQDERCVATIQQMAAAPGHARMMNVMFGVAFDGPHAGAIHQNFSWTADNFAAFVPWVAAQGICKIGVCERLARP